MFLLKAGRTFASPIKMNYHDILNLSPELQDIRKAAREFAKHKVAPLAAKIDITNKFPD